MRSFFVPLSALSLVVACGGSDPPPGDNTPYTSDPGKTTVVGGEPGALDAANAQPTGDCVRLPDGTCAEAKSCGANERRDVILDSAGKVVAVVCYPADSAPPNIDAQGNVTLDKNDNNGVVAVDGTADGVDIAGDVTAQGNNIVVYGHGIDVSVIGGTVNATGNNFSLRGVSVLGDVNVSGGNNAALILCRIEGNVHIVGNNNVIADCDILGNVVIEGVNNTLVANHVGGEIRITDAKNSYCDGNFDWNDTNTNKLFEVGEAGEPILCQEK